MFYYLTLTCPVCLLASPDSVSDSNRSIYYLIILAVSNLFQLFILIKESFQCILDCLMAILNWWCWQYENTYFMSYQHQKSKKSILLWSFPLCNSCLSCCQDLVIFSYHICLFFILLYFQFSIIISWPFSRIWKFSWTIQLYNCPILGKL